MFCGICWTHDDYNVWIRCVRCWIWICSAMLDNKANHIVNCMDTCRIVCTAQCTLDRNWLSEKRREREGVGEMWTCGRRSKRIFSTNLFANGNARIEVSFPNRPCRSNPTKRTRATSARRFIMRKAAAKCQQNAKGKLSLSPLSWVERTN